MNYSLITYRTTDYRYNRHAVVPTLYVSDLLDWLRLSECAEIVSVCDNHTRKLSGQAEFEAPMDWPSYETCERYIQTVSLVQGR